MSRDLRYSIRVSLTVVGFAMGPAAFALVVMVKVLPSSVKVEVVKLPACMAFGFFAAIGRVVISLPLISYVPAWPVNGPKASAICLSVAFPCGGSSGLGLSAVTSDRL